MKRRDFLKGVAAVPVGTALITTAGQTHESFFHDASKTTQIPSEAFLLELAYEMKVIMWTELEMLSLDNTVFHFDNIAIKAHKLTQIDKIFINIPLDLSPTGRHRLRLKGLHNYTLFPGDTITLENIKLVIS